MAEYRRRIPHSLQFVVHTGRTADCGERSQQNDAYTLEMLTNRDVITVDQDPMGSRVTALLKKARSRFG